MEFSAITHTFEQIDQVSARLEITRLLADLLKQASSEEASIICNLSLGLLRPPYQGTRFNIAEKNLIKAIAILLDRSEDTVAERAKKAGDLGLVVAQGSWRPSHTLSVRQVYKELDDLERIAGSGSQEEKVQHIQQLLSKLDPHSGKYVVRIILGTLRLGFSDMTIIDALSWMQTGDKSLRGVIEDAYNVCVDIGLIVQTLKEKGIKALESMKIHVGVPIRPAAAERLPTAKAVVEKLGHCVAQPKLDGFRIQIHLKRAGNKTDVHFFSRNLQDMSNMFPDVVQEIVKLDVKDIICEGEVIAYDQETKSYLPFQETVKRKRKHGIEQAVTEYPLHVYLFDLLYLDGESFLDETHAQRRKALLSTFKSLKSTSVSVIEEQEIVSTKDLEQYFVANIAAGLEGLVVKKPDSNYQPGKRNFNWIKLKRQEEGHLEDTLDCVILGYYAGSGKRAHAGIGAFLVGVYNEGQDMFQTIAKVGTGLSDQEWKDLKQRCDKLGIEHRPVRVECAKDLYPDVWVAPELVCMIRADEITESPVHTAGRSGEQGGFALRFPRFMGWRPDKSADQVTTVAEVKRLYHDQFARL